MLFEPHAEVFARALGRRLVVKSFDAFFGTFHRRTSRWGEKEERHEAADYRAVEIFIFSKIRQRRENGGASHRQLDRPFAQTFLHLIKIDIEPRARVADYYDRFGLHVPTCEC